eukprot:11591950-Alexandrium_andersonii.AAC.1
MSASLVGSEMCIRDRPSRDHSPAFPLGAGAVGEGEPDGPESDTRTATWRTDSAQSSLRDALRVVNA